MSCKALQNLIGKRTEKIKTHRLLLIVNTQRNKTNSKSWYNNPPFGQNTTPMWFKLAATTTGIVRKKIKNKNHSEKATVVSIQQKR